LRRKAIALATQLSPEREAECMRLYFSGRKPAQIAPRMGIKPSTVRVWVHRYKKRAEAHNSARTREVVDSGKGVA
jgi:DNA-directed RNA polymerase specialized sigma24 family protein